MARFPRFDASGAIQHVWTSGAGPSAIYRDVEDRLLFVATAASAFARFEVQCLQYCLMTTHYHFILRTPMPVLSAAMERVNGNYAKSFNRRHARRGHLFGARFGSRYVQTQEDLLGVVRYVALNPLDEPTCRHPSNWPWSSYRNAAAGLPDPLADTAALLQLVGGARRLRAFVEREPLADADAA
ncbi:MAG TPA: transposase [Gaiellaceae bacterium]